MFSFQRLMPVLGLGAALLLQACTTISGPGRDDFSVSSTALLRGGDAYPMRAIQIPALAVGTADLLYIAGPMASVAEHGGNTVAFDLPGLVPDGTYIDPAAVQTVRNIVQRAKDQHMATLIRVFGALPEQPVAARRNAAKTVALAFQDERRAVYWLDGPDAGEHAAIFKQFAPELVVAAPEHGDLRTLLADGAVEAFAGDSGGLMHTRIMGHMPGQRSLVVGGIPLLDTERVHFVLRGSDADYAMLDQIFTTPEERAGWTPDNAVLSEEERAQGFQALFNGHDLSGWWVFGDNKEGFRVNEEGAIERSGDGGRALMTVHRFDNFVLRLQYRIEEGGNSGVFLRAPRIARQSRIGMEIQIHGNDTAEPSDDMVGAVYKVVAPMANASNPPWEWNEMEIMLNDRHLMLTLNGMVVQDIDLDDYEELRHRLRSGFIGLQDHDSFVQFKNVRIKPL